MRGLLRLCTKGLCGGRPRAFKPVIPAKAGIQVGWWWPRALDSRFRGNDEWELGSTFRARPAPASAPRGGAVECGAAHRDRSGVGSAGAGPAAGRQEPDLHRPRQRPGGEPVRRRRDDLDSDRGAAGERQDHSATGAGILERGGAEPVRLRLGPASRSHPAQRQAGRAHLRDDVPERRLRAGAARGIGRVPRGRDGRVRRALRRVLPSDSLSPVLQLLGGMGPRRPSLSVRRVLPGAQRKSARHRLRRVAVRRPRRVRAALHLQLGADQYRGSKRQSPGHRVRERGGRVLSGAHSVRRQLEGGAGAPVRGRSGVGRPSARRRGRQQYREGSRRG